MTAAPAHGHTPRRIALTGSIGMGKSTVAGMLRDMGVPVFDADAEVHRLQGPDGALLLAIEAAFPGTTGADGVDRLRLGAQVFGDDAALKRLEAIVHPAVAARQSAFLAAHADKPFVVLDIPLLFEKGGYQFVDLIMVVSATAEDQRKRVLSRPGMTQAKFDDILARQTPDAEKRARADYVINTSLSLDETRAQIAAVVACLSDGTGA